MVCDGTHFVQETIAPVQGFSGCPTPCPDFVKEMMWSCEVVFTRLFAFEKAAAHSR